MKRSSVLMMGAVVAAMSISMGCSNNKKDASASNEDKYKILNGSTAGSASAAQKEGAGVAPEPALNADTRFAAGQLAESQGKFDCAAIQYEQAIRLKGDHIPSLYRLGVVQTKTKNYDKAAETWKQYIKATGDVASGYSNLGFTYEMAGDVENAEASYKKGLDRDAKSTPCRINYGLMLARQNRVTEAEVQLSAVLTPAEVSYNLASIYEQQGAMAQAKEALVKALEADPNMKAAQDKLATLPQD